MRKQDVELIKEKLSVLIGQPLRRLDRAGSLIVTDFGELIEQDIICHGEDGKLARDKNGKVLYRKAMVGRYTIDALCSMRLTCGNEILFAKSDITLPNTFLAQTQKCVIDGMEFFDWDNFDWTVKGNNYFDEMAEKYIGKDPFEFVVKKISVSKLGDLTITFENGFSLEFFADGSSGSENWKFYDSGTTNKINSLMVLGDGIEREPEPDCEIDKE